ncbi:recombinase family protein [Roseospira visakhapatnamensis]|uniref:DNA invertase Pin-like site-specific DNA recombinase n=1 Tax=Roseospira visakhapatnamensis TaxID=390880 RepID=A0A7W6WC37_9PROT|nr:recombinase family protein [Roseospira visakhapatnamensis]MBB4268202.1 DNA invertase Pin-like site-specific DNA recombinase [Roseospira visakhapatnamensis]
MLVAVYARHSTEHQCTSTADQIARCHAYCAAKDYIVVDTYADEALSGATLANRRGLHAMMRAVTRSDFERIITEDLSRISRDQSDIAALYKKLSFLGIALETVSEGEINELHIGLKGTMNALYLKDLADKTRRGMIASVKRGAIPGGRTYGYDLIKRYDHAGEPIRGARAINPGEADVIRTIFTDYAEGQSLKRICANLNAMGIASPAGKRWLPNVLVGTASRQTGILRQTLYKGLLTFNKMQFRKHPETGKRTSVMRPRDEWIEVAVPDLAIIDAGLFDKVQDLIKTRATAREEAAEEKAATTAEQAAAREAARQRKWRAAQVKSPQKRRYFFSGHLLCAASGGTMRYHRKGVYGCDHARTCPTCTIEVPELMRWSLAAFRAITEADIAAWAARPEVAVQRQGFDEMIAAIDASVASKRAEVATILDTLGSHARTREVQRYLEEREQRLRRWHIDRVNIKRRREAITPTPAVTDAALRALRSLITTLETDPENHLANTALRRVAPRVTVVRRGTVSLHVTYRELLKLGRPDQG